MHEHLNGYQNDFSYKVAKEVRTQKVKKEWRCRDKVGAHELFA